MSDAAHGVMRACPCCGLVSRIHVEAFQELGPQALARCARCGSKLPTSALAKNPGRHPSSRAKTVSARVSAVAISALIMFPPAVTLPIMRIEEMGQSTEASIWSGSLGLLRGGDWFVGGVVFVCSILFPLLKLTGLIGITMFRHSMERWMRRWSWRIVDLSGRWGMLDVLLVAVVVAWVKLGDLVQIEAGPAALAFTTVVILSLVATALFDPHAMWDDSKEHMTLPVGSGEPAAATGTQSRS